MILKLTEDEDITLHATLCLPAQVDMDAYPDEYEMDVWLKLGSDIEADFDGGFILNIKDILLEGAEDQNSAEAIISWLDFFKEEVQKKLDAYNDKG
jgi:hypothetical protein